MWSPNGKAEIQRTTGERVQAYLDTDGDYSISPRDALLVIDWLNSQVASGEGEMSVATRDAGLRWLPGGSLREQYAQVNTGLAANEQILPSHSATSEFRPAGITDATVRTRASSTGFEAEHALTAELDSILDGLAEDVLEAWGTLD